MSNVATATASPKREVRADYVTAKLRKALDLMVWDGKPYNEAAILTDISVHTMRNALARPPVLQYLKQQRQMLLASARQRNIPRLAEIRDAADNMPAVQAIRLLEEMGEERSVVGPGVGSANTPGVTINIVSGLRQHVADTSSAILPAIEHDATIPTQSPPER